MARPKERGSRRSEAERLSRELGYAVSPRSVELWARKGYNLQNTVELIEGLLSQQRPPAGLIAAIEAGKVDVPEPATSEDEDSMSTAEAGRRLKIAQYRRTAAEARIKILQAEQQAGRLVPRDEVLKEGIGIGVFVRETVMRLQSTLPPELEGLSAAQMARSLKKTLRKMCKEISESSVERIERVVREATKNS